MTKKYSQASKYQFDTNKAEKVKIEEKNREILNIAKQDHKRKKEQSKKRELREKLGTLDGFIAAINHETDSDNTIQSDDLISDNEDVDDFGDYKWVECKYSCYIEDIKGFTLGGVSSRFWQMRKHMNQIMPCMYINEPSCVPFYAWECITFNLPFTDLDLIIRKGKDMENLIRFLCYSMDTVDGHKGTA